MNWLKQLSQSAAKPSRIIIGMMSGTSVDSIDVGIVEVKGGGLEAIVKLLHFYSYPYPPSVQTLIREAHKLSIKDVSEIHAHIGDLFGAACVSAIASSGIEKSTIDLIGSHGQTVYHHSMQPGATLSTLQLGDGDRIAEKTGLPVISDFRARDVASGGQGAPLAPYGDRVLFPPYNDGVRVILNLGGIANITVIHKDLDNIIGFDTGPANGPIDRLIRKYSRGTLEYDDNGTIARSGVVIEHVLNWMINRDAFSLCLPPKSTGFESYGDIFVEEVVQYYGTVDADLIATVTEFVATTIAQNIKSFIKYPVKEVVAAGGGTKNSVLLERIQYHLGTIPLRRASDYGLVDGARECLCWAIMANDSLLGIPTSLPSVTGALHARTLGKLSFPNVRS